MTPLPAPAFAALVVVAASLVYDPMTLTVTLPDGRQEHMAAISPDTCQAAVRALASGMWAPVGMSDGGPIVATCQPGNIFPERSHCIAGHGCDTGGRR